MLVGEGVGKSARCTWRMCGVEMFFIEFGYRLVGALVVYTLGGRVPARNSFFFRLGVS